MKWFVSHMLGEFVTHRHILYPLPDRTSGATKLGDPQRDIMRTRPANIKFSKHQLITRFSRSSSCSALCHHHVIPHFVIIMLFRTLTSWCYYYYGTTSWCYYYYHITKARCANGLPTWILQLSAQDSFLFCHSLSAQYWIDHVIPWLLGVATVSRID